MNARPSLPLSRWREAFVEQALGVDKTFGAAGHHGFVHHRPFWRDSATRRAIIARIKTCMGTKKKSSRKRSRRGSVSASSVKRQSAMVSRDHACRSATFAQTKYPPTLALE